MLSLGYITEVQICIAALYLLYVIFLHRNVAHQAARIYIITMFPVACLLPLLSIPILPAPTTSQIFEVTEITMVTTAVEQTTNHINYLLLIYLFGVALMSVWIVIGAVRLYMLLRKSRPERIVGLKIIFAEQKVVAYSVFDYIFIKATLRDSSILNELLAHEEAHIRFKHTLDIIYMSTLRIVLWFNPLVWHSLSLLRQVHEYQVDEEVINQGYSTNKYINLLILSEAGISPEFASPLSYSLTKKRLMMLDQKQSVSSRNRLLLTVPVLALLMGAFSLSTRAEVQISKPDNGNDKPINSIDVQTKDSVSMALYGAKGKYGRAIIQVKGNGFLITFPEAKEQSVQSVAHDKDVVNTAESKYIHENGQLNVINHQLAVDGKRYDKPLSSVDNRTSKKIVFMRDSTSMALYGAKGKDGVMMLVTTDEYAEELDAASKSMSQEVLQKQPQQKRTETAKNGDPDVPYLTASVMPKFQGGDVSAFRNWAMSQIKYPKEAIDAKESGKVVVRFVVEKDGSVGDVKVTQGVSESIDKEAMRVVESSPKWSPGMQDGAQVRVAFSVPIAFSLDK